MSGSVEHMSLNEVKREVSSDQSRLSSFGSDVTYVSIVNSTSEEFDEYTDEHMDGLTPPDDLFYQWLNEKKKLQKEEDSVTAHNTALDYVNYDERYRSYLKSGDGKEAIEDVVDRVENGERVVLVCYCTDSKRCHREIAHERVKDTLDKVRA